MSLVLLASDPEVSFPLWSQKKSCLEIRKKQWSLLKSSSFEIWLPVRSFSSLEPIKELQLLLATTAANPFHVNLPQINCWRVGEKNWRQDPQGRKHVGKCWDRICSAPGRCYGWLLCSNLVWNITHLLKCRCTLCCNFVLPVISNLKNLGAFELQCLNAVVYKCIHFLFY